MLRMRWTAVPVLLFALGCSNVLGFDEVTFKDGDSGVAGQAGASSGGSAGSVTGGSAGASSGGQSASGGVGNAGGAPAGGGTSSGGAPSGGTSSGGASSGGSPGGGGTSSGGSPGGGGTSSGGSPGGGGTSSGGSPGGGGASSGGSSSGGPGGSPTGHYETKTEPGATGNEPGGVIPLCCVPSAAEKAQITANFNLVNQHRIANGKSALAYDTKLESAIEGHCHHMATHTFFAHDAPEASIKTPWTRATKCGTSANAENIYSGSSNATNAFNAWKNSSGHNANMLNGSLKRIGIGLYGTRWGQIFGQ